MRPLHRTNSPFLQAKLERIGTNIASSPANLKSKSNESIAGISVIRNGEPFKMNSISDVKINFDDSPRGPRSKPSCAVKPILKASPAKPSATVRPLNIEEALLKEKEAQERNGNVEISSSVQTKAISPVLVEDEGLQVVPSSSSSRLDPSNCPEPTLKVEDKRVVCLEDKNVNESNVSLDLAGHSAELRSVDALDSDIKPNTCRVVPCVPHTNGVMTASEDTFNADIVCPHGNLRIEERCKQLISREVWFKLCSYFHSPRTFQFGKFMYVFS